jgi:hypothetical protein
MKIFDVGICVLIIIVSVSITYFALKHEKCQPKKTIPSWLKIKIVEEK